MLAFIKDPQIQNIQNIERSSHNFNKRLKMKSSFLKLFIVMAAVPAVLVSVYQHAAGTSLQEKTVFREKKEPPFSLFDIKDFDDEEEDKYEMVSSRTSTIASVLSRSSCTFDDQSQVFRRGGVASFICFIPGISRYPREKWLHIVDRFDRLENSMCMHCQCFVSACTEVGRLMRLGVLNEYALEFSSNAHY